MSVTVCVCVCVCVCGSGEREGGVLMYSMMGGHWTQQ